MSLGILILTEEELVCFGKFPLRLSGCLFLPGDEQVRHEMVEQVWGEKMTYLLNIMFVIMCFAVEKKKEYSFLMYIGANVIKSPGCQHFTLRILNIRFLKL